MTYPSNSVHYFQTEWGLTLFQASWSYIKIKKYSCFQMDSQTHSNFYCFLIQDLFEPLSLRILLLGLAPITSCVWFSYHLFLLWEESRRVSAKLSLFYSWVGYMNERPWHSNNYFIILTQSVDAARQNMSCLLNNFILQTKYFEI